MIDLINLKERIAISQDYTPEERDFLLEAVNAAVPAPPGPAIAIDPGNYLARIDQLWVFLSGGTDGEGLCAAPLEPDGMMMPLIAADQRRINALRPIAQAMAQMFGRPIHLAQFSHRDDLEVFEP